MTRRTAVAAAFILGLTGCSAVESPQKLAATQYVPAMPVYVVFFSPWSSTLDAAGQSAVSKAAAAAKADSVARVNVVGYASTVGAEAANKTLSEQRAEVVRSQLVADGVDPDHVATMSRGATTYQYSPQEARRVGIEIVHAGF